MLMSDSCIPCFIKQAFIELEGSDMKDSDREKALRDVLRLLSEHPYDVTPVEIALKVHESIRSHGGGTDPYHDLKMSSTSGILGKIEDIRKRIENSSDPLKEAMIVSIAGNVIDYGAKNLFDLDSILDQADSKGLRIDHYEAIREKIMSARRCVYLLDNSGEIVMDSILMEEMMKLNPDLGIEAVVKMGPILNDVTYDDAVFAGLDDVNGVEIIELPMDGWVQPDHINDLDSDVLVISKGQGNFESLSGVSGVFFLFVVKCEHVAEFIDVDVGDMILKYNK